MDYKLRKNVEMLIASPISQYRIDKETGVSQSNISKLRRGERKVGALSLDVAEKLSDYLEELTGSGSYLVSPEFDNGFPVDESADESRLEFADALYSVEDMHCRLDTDRQKGDRALIIGGPTDVSGIIIFVVKNEMGSYMFQDDATEDFKKIWRWALSKYDFLKEDKD
ncbi:helix-turn-helix domain-containing protein [Levilactobacillus brevis]|uniref:helix-turn-helix domain-containing protein n=1 Tax=Levilactobacillus brevis TaxID=1580 RepID=UPI002072C157|nr:helix-turn-helix transcriptional regulator [Levilactobacillus brevis]MDN6763830.1 helix-turn-helix transcriptional regulator [Lactiplantibacillus plantarum]MDN6789693.1 helix-turn-helix transcriptional regulator [Lactiplantibacillus plantarum]